MKSVEDGEGAEIRHVLSTYSAIEGWRDAEEAVRRKFRQRCRQVSRRFAGDLGVRTDLSDHHCGCADAAELARCAYHPTSFEQPL